MYQSYIWNFQNRRREWQHEMRNLTSLVFSCTLAPDYFTSALDSPMFLVVNICCDFFFTRNTGILVFVIVAVVLSECWKLSVCSFNSLRNLCNHLRVNIIHLLHCKIVPFKCVQAFCTHLDVGFLFMIFWKLWHFLILNLNKISYKCDDADDDDDSLDCLLLVVVWHICAACGYGIRVMLCAVCQLYRMFDSVTVTCRQCWVFFGI